MRHKKFTTFQNLQLLIRRTLLLSRNRKKDPAIEKKVKAKEKLAAMRKEKIEKVKASKEVARRLRQEKRSIKSKKTSNNKRKST